MTRLDNPDDLSAKALPVEVQGQVEQLIFEGKKIAAIKLVRETTHYSLKTAKEYVEQRSSQ
jgi:ribosomal protein L7/L12